MGQTSALPTPTLRWMGRRTRVPRCWLSNHSYLSREITVPRFALNPLEVGTGQSENPLRWTGSKGSDPPEACLQPVPSDPEVWVLGEEKQAPILLKIPNTHSPGATHLMVGSPLEGGAAVLELREPPQYCTHTRKQVFLQVHPSVGLHRRGAERVTSRAMGISEEDQPWPLCLFASMVEIINTRSYSSIIYSIK